jgi:chromosome segregation ATPase
LREQINQQELQLNDERKKLATCEEQKRNIERAVDSAQTDRRTIEERHNTFKRELNSKNQEMQAKHAQIMDTEAQVKTAREATINNKNTCQQRQNDLDKVRGQIIQNNQRLKENQHATQTLTETMRKYEATLQVSQKSSILNSYLFLPRCGIEECHFFTF